MSCDRPRAATRRAWQPWHRHHHPCLLHRSWRRLPVRGGPARESSRASCAACQCAQRCDSELPNSQSRRHPIAGPARKKRRRDRATVGEQCDRATAGEQCKKSAAWVKGDQQLFFRARDRGMEGVPRLRCVRTGNAGGFSLALDSRFATAARPLATVANSCFTTGATSTFEPAQPMGALSKRSRSGDRRE